MTEHQWFETSRGHRLGYHLNAGAGPLVVFLGGFKSDMEGSKALFLEAEMQKAGRAFLRFDYTGHGVSDGAFTEGTIGAWAADASEIIQAFGSKGAILVGSSMGGWISLLIAARHPELVKGLVGIAAAPDFTEDSMAAAFTPAQWDEMERLGRIEIPSDYDEPYIITKALIEEGRENLVLRAPLHLPFPVRLLHGTADRDVDMSRPLAILDHATGDDIRVEFVKGADHRFSEPANLAHILAAVDAVCETIF